MCSNQHRAGNEPNLKVKRRSRSYDPLEEATTSALLEVVGALRVPCGLATARGACLLLYQRDSPVCVPASRTAIRTLTILVSRAASQLKPWHTRSAVGH